LEDEKGKIQIIFRKDVTSNFDVLDVIERGDIIGIKGNIVRTQRGELSLLVKEWKVLAKALRPLPDTWHGLKDVETRYRQRYVDLILNKEVKETFLTIHKAIHFIRSFLNEKGFIEVYTPILQPIYGGAFARPFKTFHHALEEWRWLRIAPELYLKRLLVGGFEKVYEFAPCFRNEGIDAQHNPEFIQLELYWAYVDYENVMKLIEELIYNLVKKLFGSEKIEYQGREIDFSPPWKRIRLVDAIKEYSGLDVEHMSDEELKQHARSLGIEAERRGEIIEKLFDHYAKPNLINPTFATHFPVDITPLAKRADKNYAERFELYIAGMEVVNAYTELNNPVEQYKRFKEEEELRKQIEKEDFEYMPMDRDYVRALEYGMPLAGGAGIGLGRLFMVLTNKLSLKEVILFPALVGKEEIELVVEMFPELQEIFD
jgi:lysyl-tRNA synthetase class 2